MKNIKLNILIAIAVLLVSAQISFALTSTTSDEHKKLTITIANIKNITGKIVVIIYNEADGYLKPNREYKKIYFDVEAEKMTYDIEKLAQNEYALFVYHDENNDDKCNLNFLGIPTEGYGFSQNVKPKFSAPLFSDTKIELHQDTSIYIELIH